jgi:hypothetical protein
MIRGLAARVVRAIKSRAQRVRGKLRLVTGFGNEDVMAFWRAHGAEWAREEATPEDLARVSGFVAAVEGLPDKVAAKRTAAHFREVWSKGFTSPADAWGWDEMNDRLPDAVMLSFARGAAEEFRSRQGS